MKSFESDGIKIAFTDEGTGPPILLIHGFASNYRVNWISTGWTKTFLERGRRVIALDNRGHGYSDKPRRAEAYSMIKMMDDALRLLDHLEIDRTDVMGYSMGARITAFACVNAPDRVQNAILSGIGDRLITGSGNPEPIARALRAARIADISDRQGLAFRQFADQTGSDREALAACILGSRQRLKPEALARVNTPVLIAVGSQDDVAGDPDRLAAVLGRGEAFTIEGRDHMKAVGDPSHKRAVVNFLARTD